MAAASPCLARRSSSWSMARICRPAPSFSVEVEVAIDVSVYDRGVRWTKSAKMIRQLAKSMSRSILLWAAASVSLAAEPEKLVPIFDGRTLDGWEQKNGTAKFVVEDGAI